MIDIQNTKIYFSGQGDQVKKDELEKYLLQKAVTFVATLDESEHIIEGALTPPNIADIIYSMKKNGASIINIDELEINFSSNFNISNVLMAVKLTKDNARLIELLTNKYFSDETFVSLLKHYSWSVDELYDDDESRDVCSSITSRFCTLVKRNHNIQYAPIGLYYTALETSNTKLLDLIYMMPDYTISDKNAKENQPLTLKEVVALNPNSSKTIQLEILSRNDKEEIKYLALNENIDDVIKEKLKSKNDVDISINLLKAQNYLFTTLEDMLVDERLTQAFLVNFSLNDEIFKALMKSNLSNTNIVYLSENDSLDENMILYLEAKGIENAIINILKHDNLPLKIKEKYLLLNDKIFNISIAHNSKLNDTQYEDLLSKKDLDVNISLASNVSVKKEILTALYKTENRYTLSALCSNTSTPINILMQLQLDNELNLIVKENLTYQKFAEKMLGFSQ